MEEVWKPIPIDDLGEWYEISDQGRIRSWKNKIRSKEGRILKVGTDSGGYHYLSIDNLGKRYTFRPHRLVMMAFVGQVDLDCNHKNGIKTDNRLANLEYCTRKENIIHSFKLGLRENSIGEKSHLSKLTEKQVRNIRYNEEGSTTEIAKRYGVLFNCINDIKKGRTWKHV